MKAILRLCIGLFLVLPHLSTAQCTTTNATSCSCQDGSSDCDLLPDIKIARPPLTVSGSYGVIEYSQTGNGANNGRLRISVSTPNIGFGPLEIRAQSIYVCGTDTFYGSAPATCTDGSAPKQLIKQRVYHKTNGVMTYYDRDAGTMTYHPTHGHMHVDNWGVFTLRSATADPNPLNWPIIGDGAKLAFCLMDYGSCSTYNGHCVDSNGTTLTNGNFPNYGLGGGSYSCSPTFQGISSGFTDIYYQSLDGMWIDIPPGVCNGQYYIVAQIDPFNYFLESKENNNIMVVPWTLTRQTGSSSSVTASGPTALCPGQSVTLTAGSANSYLWSNGATTQSITVNTAGSYSATTYFTGCTFTSTPVTVTINSLNVTSSATPAVLCQGSQTQLSSVVSNTPQQGPVEYTTSVPVPIIDYNSTTGATPVYSPLVVSGVAPATLSSGSIVSVKINLTHTYDADIEIWVKAPSGDSTLLSNRRGGSGDNFTNTIFSMSASTLISAGIAPFTNTYKPDGNLNNLTGNINGTWKLIVIDRAGTDVGQILNWTLTVLNNETYSYAWSSNPAGFTSGTQNPSVSPLASTTYTVTATSSATGCSGTSSVMSTVVPAVSVNAVSPSQGAQGTLVLISGAGFSGATSVTFNGVAATSFSINSDNQIAAVVPAGSATGIVCVSNGAVCTGCSAGSFTVVNTFTLGVHLFIQGFYTGSNTMVAVADPQNHPLVCDTIVIELIENLPGYPVVFSNRALLATNGTAQVEVPSSLAGKNCYIRVRHRNALQTWSNSAFSLTGGALAYDFSNAMNKAYGSNQKAVGGGVFALFSGDVNQDEFLESTDYSQIENNAQAFMFGYLSEDLNGDWIVESGDYSMIENSSQSFIYVLRP